MGEIERLRGTLVISVEVSIVPSLSSEFAKLASTATKLFRKTSTSSSVTDSSAKIEIRAPTG